MTTVTEHAQQSGYFPFATEVALGKQVNPSSLPRSVPSKAHVQFFYRVRQSPIQVCAQRS